MLALTHQLLKRLCSKERIMRHLSPLLFVRAVAAEPEQSEEVHRKLRFNSIQSNPIYMNILIIGGGAREHALSWKLSTSSSVAAVYVAPGNAGTANQQKIKNIPIGADNFAALLKFAVDHDVSLHIFISFIQVADKNNPDRPPRPWARTATRRWHRACLPQGSVQLPLQSYLLISLLLVGIPVFGPSKQAARMEGSKVFAKDFMQRHSIPTANFRVFNSSQYAEALEYTQTCGHRVVLKASGLAAGKGVLIPESPEDVKKGLNQILVDNIFGDAGQMPCELLAVILTL